MKQKDKLPLKYIMINEINILIDISIIIVSISLLFFTMKSNLFNIIFFVFGFILVIKSEVYTNYLFLYKNVSENKLKNISKKINMMDLISLVILSVVAIILNSIK